MMGPLPAVRLQQTRPFLNTGVDYAGPFFMRFSPGRGSKTIKGYVSLFVCMSVRAVHIEVVSDLTTEAFLAAFYRFAARRGLPATMYSDNGTNFVGAEAELQKLFSKTSAMCHEVAAEIAKDNVEWHFSPPKGANFGGLWEANIKSFKRHFRKVIGDSRLTYEEFSTVAAKIEAVMNSRPLCALGSDVNDAPALTPGHFLIGASMTAPPEPFQDIDEKSTTTKWHRLTVMRNHFWHRWHKEVMAQLQQRSKWFYPNYTFKTGDVVMFKDELLPPTKWPLARITKLYPGRDGKSRVADIETSSSAYTRPVNKLIVLPVNQDIFQDYKDSVSKNKKDIQVK